MAKHNHDHPDDHMSLLLDRKPVSISAALQAATAPQAKSHISHRNCSSLTRILFEDSANDYLSRQPFHS